MLTPDSPTFYGNGSPTKTFFKIRLNFQTANGVAFRNVGMKTSLLRAVFIAPWITAAGSSQLWLP